MLRAFPLAAFDRLDAFRELAQSRLNPVRIAGEEAAGDAYREIYSLLDEEIVESLATGGLFASTAFLQDRLDGFADAWGTAALRVVRVGRLVVGAFELTDSGRGNSVRVFGRLRQGSPALLSVIAREGRPAVHPMPPDGQGRARFLVVWEGPASGHGSHALRLDLYRQQGDDVGLAWTTARLFADGLVARAWTVRGEEVRVRYELRYPGWTPGCEPQAEQEDVYRLSPATGTFIRTSRRQFNAWHLALRATVDRLFAALAAGDRAALVRLVPDAAVRERLPSMLAGEPACDAPDGVDPTSVSVAAVAAERRPWALTFRQAGRAWRLVAAAPVLQ